MVQEEQPNLKIITNRLHYTNTPRQVQKYWTTQTKNKTLISCKTYVMNTK